MRQITRRFLVFLALVGVGLLALGVLPGFLATGEAYHLTATTTNASGSAVNATMLSMDRYPYMSEALADGRSSAYRKGPWGLKETFTHSPFDELEALTMRSQSAQLGADAVLVEYKGERYRLEIRQS